MTDFTPLYVQIARDIRVDILNGVYQMGDAIPSEQMLVKRYSTTRGTARSAIAMLVNEGLVRQVRGKGTFVQLRSADYRLHNFGGFTDSLQNSSQVAVSHVVEQTVVTVDGDEQLRLVRVRGISDGRVTRFLSVDASLIPLARFPGIDEHDFENASLYRVFRDRYGVHPHRTEIALSTEIPDERVVALLSEAPGQALLSARGAAFDERGDEVERIHVVYGSAVQFSLTTTIHDIPGPGSASARTSLEE